MNSNQLSTRWKSTLKTALRTRNASVQGTSPTSRKEKNEEKESLSDIIWLMVKEELAAHEKTIKDREMGELSKSLEFNQSQLDEELGNVKKNISKLENNIKSIEKDLLDPDDISAKLVELWR